MNVTNVEVIVKYFGRVNGKKNSLFFKIFSMPEDINFTEGSKCFKCIKIF